MDIRRAVALGWGALFLFLLLRYSSAAPPPALAWAVVAAGWAAALAAGGGAQFARFLRDHAAILAAAASLALLIALAQSTAHTPWAPTHERVPSQSALLLCLVPLAFFLAREPLLWTATGVLACALSLWHFGWLPLEGITGWRLGWNLADPLPRSAGPLNFQASGLAHQAYFFAGLFLPLFYVGWGWASERLAARERPRARRLLLAAALLWLLPVLCVQSRSALAGAAMASGLLVIALQPPERRRRAWVAALALAVLVALVYAAMFSGGKTGADLRLAYAQLYWRESLHWPQWLTGHGFNPVPPPHMQVRSYPISHSHNDLLQVLYSWGLPALLAYVAFLVALVGAAWRQFRLGVAWPLAALLALAPNLVTDLGLHHYEKAGFMVLLAALCLARQRPETPSAG